ncbi:hypothetical protein [Streptomyces sp. NPDC002088]|uniref:hypothetical protein n=1 Tax=Streptomyces sp. NPDC002088 TaxID=3154665 RepID=UPI00333360D3
MRIARLGCPGQEIPVVPDGDRVLDLRAVTPDVTPEFLGHGLPTLDVIALPQLPDAEGLRFGPPVTRPIAEPA